MMLRSAAQYCNVLYYTVLYCTVLYCTVLYCTVLYCTVLYCTVLYCTVLYCTCTVLYCTVLHCTVLYFTATLAVAVSDMQCQYVSSMQHPVDLSIRNESKFNNATMLMLTVYNNNKCLLKIRMGKYGEDKKSELVELGFLFDNQRAKYGFDLVKVALIRYKEIYGNFLVKQKFLIPTGDAAASSQWPEKTWGIKLGTRILHE